MAATTLDVMLQNDNIEANLTIDQADLFISTKWSVSSLCVLFSVNVDLISKLILPGESFCDNVT